MWGHKQRTYYNFSEIIQGCGISKTGLDNCILNGTLAVHAWVPPISVFKIEEIQIHNQVVLTRTEMHWEGYTPIHVADYRKILHKGTAFIREFPGMDVNQAICLKPGAVDVEVSYDDLVILVQGKEQLEEHLGLRADGECTVEIIGKAMGPQRPIKVKCAPDFRHVIFKERDYSFGVIQSSIIKRLYYSAMEGDPWQNGKRLLQDAGSETFTLKDIFKRQPYWRELIISDSRGLYRLHEDFIAGVVIDRKDSE